MRMRDWSSDVCSSVLLEFSVVFLAGMEEGLFPHSRALQEDGGLEEERRLCYVGMTRAKRHLVLTYARTRAIFGTTMPGLPSRFLDEVPHDLITQPTVQIGRASRRVEWVSTVRS